MFNQSVKDSKRSSSRTNCRRTRDTSTGLSIKNTCNHTFYQIKSKNIDEAFLDNTWNLTL